MKIQILQTTDFGDEINSLIAKKKLRKEDFEDFKKDLAENPEMGSVISGTGGIRKTRLKSASKGKRGGFRVCYLNIKEKIIVFLLFIYAKNEKENLTEAEKAELKLIAEAIKRNIKNEKFI
jgi:Protein of unknown function (DUF1044).